MGKKIQYTTATPKNPGQREMAALLQQSGIDFSNGQLSHLWSYHNLLRQSNPELNLTRIHNFTNMVLKLYVDSLLPGMMVDLPSPLLDLGTGPGMPGIPLKIAFPDLDIILAESRGQRVTFLESVITRLKLDRISVVGKSITPRFETPVAGVITRAVEDIGATLERIAGCLDAGGQAIFMKGPQCAAEIDAAVDRFAGQYQLIENRSYRIPHTIHARRLVVFRRLTAPVRTLKEQAMTRHTCRTIESEQNGIFKDLKKLLSGRGIKKQQMALISGSKPVGEAIASFPERCTAWISPENRVPPPPDFPGHADWYQISPPLFALLDVFGTNAPLLLVKTPQIDRWAPETALPQGCSLFVPFQDPENVGTVIRSAVAFGVQNVILLAESAHPFHPKSIRASGGAVFHAHLLHGPSISDLPGDLPILPLSAEGKDIAGIRFPETFGILPGIEGPGLPDRLRQQAVSIPIQKEVESLNAATATAIALYLWSRRDCPAFHSA